MYHAIARRRAAAVFDLLGESEWEKVVDQLADDVCHTFPGRHPLGGTRHSRDGVRRWFERLERLFPGHTFRVQRVVSRGWPWDTWIAVQWSAALRPAAGRPYANHGSHWIQIRWGKVKSFHGYLDTQLIVDACEEMAKAGIAEASAPPIT
jgi:ketosteroid isomerase-like protein